MRTSQIQPGNTHFFTGFQRDKDLLSHCELTSVYYARDMQDLLSRPLNVGSHFLKERTDEISSPLVSHEWGKRFSAGLELMERATNRYNKPVFGISDVTCSDGLHYDIGIKSVSEKPFCRLLHLKKKKPHHSNDLYAGDPAMLKQPKLLIVAPYSGHYATLLRDTVRRMLVDHDVYITDWANARDVSVTHGCFNLDDYIQYLMDFVKKIGPGYHMLGVCQPAVPVLAMTAIMADQDDELQPLSMTLMGGPIDTRINPTKVNEAAKQKDIDWFGKSVVSFVPHYYPGALRRVIPGFLMLQGFMSLNIDAHLQSSKKLFDHLIKGSSDSAKAHRIFYDEYRSVLDLPAHYFLDSVRVAFQTHALPKGEMTWKGKKVDTSLIRKTALMTVEGEKDDISGVGQTFAAHTICPNIPQKARKHHLEKGVGHYGVFNGSHWRESIAPQVTKFIYANDPMFS